MVKPQLLVTVQSLAPLVSDSSKKGNVSPTQPLFIIMDAFPK
jgi:hypothetical protein